ncbi:MAG: hypothetical protein MUF23_18985, partial [Pirellula sp.]|nr:hypothetical protein [Pirellula sp.]
MTYRRACAHTARVVRASSGTALVDDEVCSLSGTALAVRCRNAKRAGEGGYERETEGKRNRHSHGIQVGIPVIPNSTPVLSTCL